jgi:tetratricopeptide (TPR) repeat protein
VAAGVTVGVGSGPGRVDLDELAQLEEQRDFLLRSLDDLEAERAAGDIEETDYTTLRDDYTRRAAEVIRAIDEGQASLASARAARRQRGRGRRPVVTVAAVLLVVAVAVGAGMLVARSSGDRLPGDTATGDIRTTNSRLLAEAGQLFQEGKALEAIKRYDAVLERDPDNREALAYRGWLLVLAGLPDEGLTYIDRAIEVSPDYPDARFFRGFVLRRQGRLDEAVAELRLFLSNDPPPGMVAQVEELIEEIEAERQSPPGAGGSGSGSGS